MSEKTDVPPQRLYEMRWCPSCAGKSNTYAAGSGDSVPVGSVCCARCMRVLEIKGQ